MKKNQIQLLHEALRAGKDVAGVEIEELPNVDTFWVKITPNLAGIWLDTSINSRNRLISMQNVQKIQKDIEEDRFQLTHQGLAFYENGILADGQHRLRAIKEGKKTVLLPVTFGLPADAIAVIDVGKARSGAQIHQILMRDEVTGAAIKHSSARIAACRIYMGLVNANFSTAFSNTALHECGKEFEQELTAVLNDVSITNYYAPVLGAFLYAYPVDPTKIMHFMQLLEYPHRAIPTGVSLSIGSVSIDNPSHPVRVATNALRLVNRKYSYQFLRYKLAIQLLRAMHAFVLNQPLVSIRPADRYLHQGYKWFSEKRRNLKKAAPTITEIDNRWATTLKKLQEKNKDNLEEIEESEELS